MKPLLQILALVFIIPGFFTAISAKWLVAKFNMEKDAKCDFENEMNEEELKQYKFNKAVVNLKMMGMLVALPGLILIFVVFR